MSTVKFVLFDINSGLVAKWRKAFDAFVPQECRENVTIVESTLDDLPKPFDCIVSPANSFGRLDGAFDQLLSDLLAPADDNDGLTRVAQSVLYERWRGFAPPGTCTLVPLRGTPCGANPAGCAYFALCPTMRFPASVRWHREIVYNCVWSLLAAVDVHNAGVDEGKGGERIGSVVMTGLATGVGRVPVADCARQTALAFAHFHEAKRSPEKWSAMSWKDISGYPLDVELPSEQSGSGVGTSGGWCVST